MNPTISTTRSTEVLEFLYHGQVKVGEDSRNGYAVAVGEAPAGYTPWVGELRTHEECVKLAESAGLRAEFRFPTKDGKQLDLA